MITPSHRPAARGCHLDPPPKTGAKTALGGDGGDLNLTSKAPFGFLGPAGRKGTKAAKPAQDWGQGGIPHPIVYAAGGNTVFDSFKAFLCQDVQMKDGRPIPSPVCARLERNGLGNLSIVDLPSHDLTFIHHTPPVSRRFSGSRADLRSLIEVPCAGPEAQRGSVPQQRDASRFSQEGPPSR